MDRREFFLTLAALPLALVAKPKPRYLTYSADVMLNSDFPLYESKASRIARLDPWKSYNTWYTWEEGPWRHYD